MMQIDHFKLSIMLEGSDGPVFYKTPTDNCISVKEGIMTFPYILDDYRQGVAGFPVSKILCYSIIPVLKDPD